ncbi:MAG: DUF6273 domain-containing protein [Lachnospiraceae bacterium]|nr:DUF6273 domain-containing protein [Lachnospiraceae bacterium]
MGKQMKRYAKTWLCVILSMLMVISVFQFGTIKTNAEGNGTEDTDINPLGVQKGDIIKFGEYEQDGNYDNGREPIEWIVLYTENDKALVMSKYILDAQEYNNQYTEVTWETCSLRKWLNDSFIRSAFSATENKKIMSVKLMNMDNPYWNNTEGGNDTIDKVFSLSLDQIVNYIGYQKQHTDGYYFGANQMLIAEPTKYADARISPLFKHTITEEDYESRLKSIGYTRDVIGLNAADWGLRTVGQSNFYHLHSSYFGWVSAHSDVSVDATYGVRPAMFLDLKKVYPSSISLDRTSAKMFYGEKIIIKAKIQPENATETDIKWSVSDPTMAKIETVSGVENAFITIKNKAGVFKVTAETENGKKADCYITVLCENNPDNPFADVKSGDWKYKAALFVYENGYMTGKGTLEGKVLFEPDSNITRGEFVQILYSAEGKPEVEYSPRFSDVPKGKWFTNAVLWAEKNGIVAGTPDGIFDVYGNATREQMAMMFYKYAVFKGYDTSVKEGGKTLKDFTDSGKVSGWAKTAVEWAVSRGIISGKGSAATGLTIDPQGKATRVETAAILRTFISTYAETGSNMITEEYIYIDDVDNDIEENEDFSEENKFNVIN